MISVYILDGLCNIYNYRSNVHNLSNILAKALEFYSKKSPKTLKGGSFGSDSTTHLSDGILGISTGPCCQDISNINSPKKQVFESTPKSYINHEIEWNWQSSWKLCFIFKKWFLSMSFFIISDQYIYIIYKYNINIHYIAYVYIHILANSNHFTDHI